MAQIVGYAAQMISRFVFLIFIGRLAGAENVGDFSFVVTYNLAFTFLTDLGLGWLLTREVARYKDEVARYVGNAFVVSLLMSGVSLAVMGLLINLLGYSQHLVRAVYVGSLALVLETFSNLLWGAFRAHERMELEMVSLVAQEGAFLLGGTLALLLDVPFIWVFVAYLISRGVGLATTWIIYRRTIGPIHWRFEWSFCRQQIAKALPFSMNMALSMVYVRVDVLMLSYWHGSTDLGYYEAATNLALRLNILARVFITSMAPMMSQAYLESTLGVRRFARAAVRYLALLSFPLTVGVGMLAAPIIDLIYGLEEFAPSVLVLQILAGMTVLRFLDTTLSTTLTTIDRQGWRTACVAIAAVVNIGLNLLLLPRYTYVGASIATILTEMAFFVALTLFLRRCMPEVIQLRVFLRPLLAALVMAIPLWLLSDWSIWALVPLGLAVYVGVLFALRTFSAQERQTMRRILAATCVLPVRWWRR